MTNIINSSGILSWQVDNIRKAPSRCGIYVLRTSTEISSIIYVGSTDNIERRLSEHFLSNDIPGVLFFDWYETSTPEIAQEIEKKWIIEYAPKYNERVG